MRKINIKMVLDYLKDKKTIIKGGIVLFMILLTLINITIFNNNDYKKTLEENKELIFYNEENIKAINKIDNILTEKEKLELELEKTTSYKDCIGVQLERLATSQEVLIDYCDKFNEVEEIETDHKEVKPADSTDLEVEKQLYFLCIELGASDPVKCATYGTIVKAYESGHGGSRRCNEDFNCFWIRLPTDKEGLKWNWKIGTGNHIIFETKELGAYAFAYYYSNYHENRSPENFTNRWVGWNNENYIDYIKYNYDALYKKYQNFFDF